MFSLTDIRQPDCSPIKENEMKRMKKRRREILRARKSFIELALFLTFLTVLYLVSFSNRDPHWFFATNHIEQHLISFPHEIAAKTTQSFSKVSQALFVILVEKRCKIGGHQNPQIEEAQTSDNTMATKRAKKQNNTYS